MGSFVNKLLNIFYNGKNIFENFTDHSIVQAEMHLWGPTSPKSCSKQGHLAQPATSLCCHVLIISLDVFTTTFLSFLLQYLTILLVQILVLIFTKNFPRSSSSLCTSKQTWLYYTWGSRRQQSVPSSLPKAEWAQLLQLIILLCVLQPWASLLSLCSSILLILQSSHWSQHSRCDLTSTGLHFLNPDLGGCRK